jgi:CRISPR/Cas system-associated protein Cas10 (large subunit of type III CRISPR-Cas system)
MRGTKRHVLQQAALCEENPELRQCSWCGTASDITNFTNKRTGELTKLCAECRGQANERTRVAHHIAMALRERHPDIYADLLREVS